MCQRSITLTSVQPGVNLILANQICDRLSANMRWDELDNSSYLSIYLKRYLKEFHNRPGVMRVSSNDEPNEWLLQSYRRSKDWVIHPAMTVTQSNFIRLNFRSSLLQHLFRRRNTIRLQSGDMWEETAVARGLLLWNSSCKCWFVLPAQ